MFTYLWRLVVCLQLVTLTVMVDAREHSSSTSAPPESELPTVDDFLVTELDEIEPAFALFPGKMYAGRLAIDNDGGDDCDDDKIKKKYNVNARNLTRRRLEPQPQQQQRRHRRRGYLMFWLFVHDTPIVDDALMIWLNGGPGCSSIGAGVLFEHAPVTVPLLPAGFCCSSPTAPLQYNPYSWANASAILYVEQPIGTGFSTAEGGTPIPRNENEVSGDFYAFLQNFYRVFADFQQHRLFVTGESYAGYFVPSIARRIHLENQKLRRNPKTAPAAAAASITGTSTSSAAASNNLVINLAGIALGNGWMDASVQGPITIDYAYWHGMIDTYTRDNLKLEWEHCLTSPPSDPEPDPFHKFNIPDDCSIMEGVLLAAGTGAFPLMPTGPNTYDVTTWDNYPIIQDGDSTFNSFLNDPRVKEALHAPMDREWRTCVPGAGRRRKRRLHSAKHKNTNNSASSTLPLDNNDSTEGYLVQDRPVSVVPYVAELLDADLRALIYSGDRDMSTCVQGSEALLNKMDWKGSADQRWLHAPRGLWVVNGQEVAGYAKSYLGLQFVVVYNSGHLVPYNQPANGLDIIVRFLQNKSFSDYPLPNFGEISAVAAASHTAKPTTTKAANATVQPAAFSLPYSMVALVLLAAVLLSFGAGYWVATNFGGGGRRQHRGGYQYIGNAEVDS